MRIRRDVIVDVILCAFVAHVGVWLTEARQASRDGDWPTYNRDLAGTRYSPLTQINTKNVSRTGKELWSTRFDYNVTAIPITYIGRNGKQYVAVVAATQGQGNDESLHVFALPSFAPGAAEGKP